jgi:L-ascorbate metabolism protein UlaG (beta-lactamase superfamily)
MEKKFPKIHWLGHSSLRIETSFGTMLVDPWKLDEGVKADFVLITHSHFDHLSVDDIKRALPTGKSVVAPPDCLTDLQQEYDCHPISPGMNVEFENFNVTATPAYNPKKDFHPRNNNWVGYIIDADDTRIYVAGDTDLIPEMEKINADIVILPVGGTYTMDINEAAKAVKLIKPKIAIPIHYGDIVGKAEDGQKFARLLPEIRVEILTPESSHLNQHN